VCDAWGQPANEISFAEERLLQAIHPDDRECLASIWDRAYKEHVPYEIEYRLVLAGGEVRHNHEIGKPEFDESGRYLGHFGTTQDTTDRKRAEEVVREHEEQYRTLIERSIQGVLIHRNDKPLFANQALADSFGYDGPEEILALSSVGELKVKHEQERLKQYSLARLHNESAPVRYEFEGLRKDGTSIWLENFVTVIIWNGEPAVQSTTVNITKRRRAEQALKTSERELQERLLELEQSYHAYEAQGADLANRVEELSIAHQQLRCAKLAQSQFLANMSHELRTPLNAIIGFSEIIESETLGPVGSVKYRDYAGDIHESGQHLLELINDILDLSKVESGTDELHEDKIEIPEIIRSALKLVGHRAEQGGVKLELELADQLPALRADERKLKQILVNLLSNAIKFTDAGGEVALWAWCRMGSGYVFQIIDTGIGIAPEDIPKALSRFGQVDGDLNRQYEGTGLGLPLTKALVELHGGVLDLQSQVGVGTTVTVRFPAERIVASLDHADSLDMEDRAAS
jgi:PAS domain S-box-containing protein